MVRKMFSTARTALPWGLQAARQGCLCSCLTKACTCDKITINVRNWKEALESSAFRELKDVTCHFIMMVFAVNRYSFWKLCAVLRNFPRYCVISAEIQHYAALKQQNLSFLFSFKASSVGSSDPDTCQ